MIPPFLSAEAAYRSGLELLGQGRNQDAAARFEKAIGMKPNLAEAHHFLGIAVQRLGHSRRAAACFERAISLNPAAALSYVELGHLLLSLGEPAGAVRRLRMAVELQPKAAKAHFLLARALAEEQRFDEAEASLARTLELEPNLASAYVLRGRLLQQRGRFEQAEAALRSAISLGTGSADGYYALVNAKRLTEDDRALVSEIEELIEGGRLKPDELRPLHYALGKAYDDLGDYERAMAHFHEANRLSQARLTSLGRAFSPERTKQRIDETIVRFDEEFLREAAGLGSDSAKPIFIVGMARSGTTLLEQIVSNHPRVCAAGELGVWREMAGLEGPANPTANAVQSIAQTFLARLEQHAPDADRVTVKTPQNYMILGQILTVFPECRILHCRRNPIDTCLSIYTTCFFAGPDFAHDPESLACAYREYLRIMAHWRRVLPPTRFMEVSYEELVAEREPVLRRVIEFLGLEWDEALLHHERNVHPIATPSLWQARQPVFARSVGRWRRYEPWLGPLQPLLEFEPPQAPA